MPEGCIQECWGRGALPSGRYCCFPLGWLHLAAICARANCHCSVKRQGTNFPRIRHVAPTKHSLPEAQGWLCMQRCAGRDAQARALYLGGQNSAVNNRNFRWLHLVVLKGSMLSQVSSNAVKLGEGGFSSLTSLHSSLNSHLVSVGAAVSARTIFCAFFPHISNKWGHGGEVPKVIFQSLVFLM